MSKLAVPVIVVATLGSSAAGGYLLLSAREQPSKKDVVERGVVVETSRVKRANHQLDVRASGVVIPARDLDVFPQVAGRIDWMYERLTPGTFVKRGQTLYRIDPRDYRLALERARAELKQAESALKIEQGQQKLARYEWETLDLGRETPGNLADPALALRKPQLEAAESVVETARAAVARAELDLARTSFAPAFDAVIVESNAEVGQLVTPSTAIARLVGTDEFRVRISVPAESLRHVSIPGINGEVGSTVAVRQAVGDALVERSGRVIRLLSALEPSSRMAALLVEIDDPYGLDVPHGDAGARPYPVLLDTYIEVVIAGRHEQALVELPRRALREGNLVYVFDPETSTLDIRRPEIVWQLPDSVLVDAGLDDGDQVIVSPLSGAVKGMRLRAVPDTAGDAAAERSLVDG